MTISEINIYSAAAIVAEIDDISRFGSKGKLAAYASFVQRQVQSGNTARRGHITKHGPSMLRFILVTAAHSMIEYSKRMRSKYLSLVKRLGKNRAIFAITRILLESIFIKLSRKKEFDNIMGKSQPNIKIKDLKVKQRAFYLANLKLSPFDECLSECLKSLPLGE